eukprot:Gregarina_sp_Poly_1__8823@NODE_52_length_17545_cov_128_515219_g44_i0_p3_GENE_NODE_52_length_17545_cov_128_515219_g44_i0NODE_52_length_17545_cov_128_515219_g44_i0_p3_ORF_typecomplete_len591_score54_39SLC35F/PF06027_12/3_9e35CRTlike/PF08627_10/8_3e26CRTlike/PF08627_10/87Nuc_sug_transp/PF04142_15/1e23UAA/PF08449_11/3_9e19TPT/PF03151_16/4_2e18PUNUT/PF16913_5/3_5e12EamA/PF00892_20/7e09EamA/PF00892_20/3_8Mg_trans_NIPA/PF05653_14/1_2e06Mg_trans_NIPA/PF05653_14/5_7_NODE_52_length_17545_cov_128_515219_g4
MVEASFQNPKSPHSSAVDTDTVKSKIVSIDVSNLKSQRTSNARNVGSPHRSLASTHQSAGRQIRIALTTAFPSQAKNEMSNLENSIKPQTIFNLSEATQIPRWVLPLASVITLVTGTANMLLVKWSGRQSAYRCGDMENPACIKSNFNAPFAQQACNCLGQAFCLVLHWSDVWTAKARGKSKGWLENLVDDGQEGKPRPRPHAWIIPAVCDFVGSILILYALYLSSASNVQVLRNFNLVVCAALSVCWLGSTLRVFHWIGILIMSVGFILTGIDSTVHPDVNAHSKHSWLGSFLAIAGTSISAFQLVFEEHLFRKFSCSPFEAVGWVGTHEIVLTAVAIAVAHVSKLEDARVSAHQAFHNPIITLALCLFVLSVALFTAFGLATTRIASAMLTATLFASRQVLVWIAEIALGWNKFYWLAFFGIVFVLLGFFVYNHLIPTRFCGWYEDIAFREWRWECSCFCADGIEGLVSDLSEDSLESLGGMSGAANTDVSELRRLRPKNSGTTSVSDGPSLIPKPDRAFGPLGLDTKVMVVAGPHAPKPDVMRQMSGEENCAAWLFVEKEEVWVSRDDSSSHHEQGSRTNLIVDEGR